jgi:O-antigen ligase
VALGFCLIVYSVVARRWGVLFAGFLGVLIVALRSSPDQIVILDRFTTVGWDASSEARFLTQDYAIQDFLDHPLFGNAYVEPATMDYPHNLILDTAMSLGLVGLVLLAIFLFQAGREVAARLKEGRFLVPLLGLQFFMAAQFSGSIWGHSNLLTMAALLLVWARVRRESAVPARAAPR